MSKEYHITFSFETEAEGSKMAIAKVQRMMKESGAELISKNDDYDGFMDIVFHHYSTAGKVSKNCADILDAFKNTHFHFSATVYEHNPSVLVDAKDVKDIAQFTSFVEKLATDNGGLSVKQDSEDPNLLRVNFTKSQERQSFQNEYVAKADQYMKNGHSSVEVFPDWEDTTVFQKNNYAEPKKSTRHNY